MRKTYVWIILLAVLMFGVGTATGILSERVSGSAPDLADLDTSRDRGKRESRDDWRDRGPRGDDRRRGDRPDGPHPPRGSSLGPRVDSIRHLADELSMTEDQRAELDRIVRETSAAIEEHERAIAEEALEARRRVDELLTEDQRQFLDDRVTKWFEAMRAEKLASLTAWLEENASLTGDELAAARVVVSDWLEAKGEYFRGLRREDGWPNREEQEKALGALSAERDEALGQWLDAPLVERFHKIADGRDRGPRSGDGRGGRDRDRDRDGRGRHNPNRGERR